MKKVKKMAVGGMGAMPARPIQQQPARPIQQQPARPLPGGGRPAPGAMPSGGRPIQQQPARPIQQQPARPLPGGAGRPTVDAIPMPGTGVSKPGPMPMPGTGMSKPGPMPMPGAGGGAMPTPMPMPGGVKPMTAGPQGMAIKKGGAIKAKKMASGGKVSSASKRADGCAQRGKTRGKMV